MYRTTIIYRLYSPALNKSYISYTTKPSTRFMELKVLRDHERETLKVGRNYQAR